MVIFKPIIKRLSATLIVADLLIIRVFWIYCLFLMTGNQLNAIITIIHEESNVEGEYEPES